MLTLLLTLVLADARPHCVALAPDGTVAAGCADGAVRFLNAAGRLEGHIGPVWSVLFSPDGKTLFAGSRKEVSDEKSLQADLAGRGPAERVEVVAWDVATRKKRWRHVEARVNYPTLAVSPDGKTLAGSYGLNGAMVRLWEADTGKEVFTFAAGRGVVEYLTFSPDGKTLVAGTSHGIRILSGRRERALLPDLYGRATFSHDGKLLAAWGRRALLVCDTATGRVLREIEDAGYGAAALVPKTNVVAVAGSGGITFLDLATGKQVARFAAPLAGAITFSPDGRRMAALAGSWDEVGFNGTVKVWDTPKLP